MNYVLSVTEINRYVKELISRDLVLSNLWVRGEISNFKLHYSGHMYFTVKDENSLIKSVMFKTQGSALGFIPENGMKVIIKGYVSVFERDGQYQLYVQEMQPDGIGSLHIAFEQLKKKLQAEGIFDEFHKKAIPYLPETIGVVTSSTGAVIRDIINVISRRFPNVELKIFPVAVQGDGACIKIAHAIRKLNELNCIDVIIVARGGGSLEELWPFNEEIVARSIFESKIPVISAVGHETDFTISDFAADLRAPTPSAAAELVVPDKGALANNLSSLKFRLKNSVFKRLSLSQAELDRLKNSMVFRQPHSRIHQERLKLDTIHKYMCSGLQLNLEKSKSNLSILAGKLHAMSPLTVLSRGYSITRPIDKEDIVKSVNQVKEHDKVEISVSDGKLICNIDKIIKS